jgi:2-succinyl-6-hydroxy-2,4-cyclohexadiene-1-carboxylate synthase
VLEAAPPHFALCGYSFGGRIAQELALAAPHRVTRLVLVATTAGIDEAADRAQRRAADEAMAADMERGTIEQWADRWQAQPLFAGTGLEAARAWREDLLRNDPRALAEALRALGTGSMQPRWAQLPALTMPVTLVVGSRDTKFLGFAQRYAALLPHARVVQVPGAGHGLPREAPAALAAALAAAAADR